MSHRTAYYCGRWIAESDLSISVDDLGFAMGITVTERLRTFGHEVFRPDAHLERMRRSLQIIGLPAEAMVAELAAVIDEYVERHRDQMEPGDDWSIVLFATPGSGAGPTLCVHGMPIDFAGRAAPFDSGIKLVVSDHRQVPPNCWPAEAKHRSRMHYYLADLQAARKSADAKALLLDQEGYVGESSTANVVMYQQGVGVVTPTGRKVLPGVSVAVVGELANRLGIAFAERDFTLDELRQADEVWLTSTTVCMQPAVSLDGQAIGSGAPGPMFQRFLGEWSDLVGLDIRQQALRMAGHGPSHA